MADETPGKGSKNPATPDDLVKFLVSCVNNSESGKISWKEVAEECGITSGNTAAKRYERLLKSHNIEKKKPGAKAKEDRDGTAKDGAPPATPKAKAARTKNANGETPKKTPVTKKRKITDIEKDDEEA